MPLSYLYFIVSIGLDLCRHAAINLKNSHVRNDSDVEFRNFLLLLIALITGIIPVCTKIYQGTAVCYKTLPISFNFALRKGEQLAWYAVRKKITVKDEQNFFFKFIFCIDNKILTGYHFLHSRVSYSASLASRNQHRFFGN